MARSIDTRATNEGDEETVDIWTANQATNATTAEVVDYITNKINDYDDKGLRGADLFEYWRCDFEHFTSIVYKKTTAKTKALRDYLLENRV